MFDEELRKLFHPGESPYMSMYIAGLKGIPLDDVANYLRSIGTYIRDKDVKQWHNGYRKNNSKPTPSLNPFYTTVQQQDDNFHKTRLKDFPQYPSSWKPLAKRFFPCNENNTPMVRWGWKQDNAPALMTYSQAKEMSPCGWIGQNMLYQKFIVLDIDGVGHGEIDYSTIAFGELFKNKTLTFEDPNKKGSFHLYFYTDRIIPVKHFNHAKIDLMGNAVNAAVYFKNKQSNNIPIAELTEDIWSAIMAYQINRKELRYA